MKLLPLFMLFALFCTAPAVRAEEQGVNKKFGKPTMQELEMTVYEPDLMQVPSFFTRKVTGIFTMNRVRVSK